MKGIIRKVAYHVKNRSIIINGRKRRIPYDMHLHYSLTKNNIVEDQLINFLKRIVKQGNTFIDIGANVGWISLEVASFVGEKGSIYSFEPIKHLCRLFEQLINLNKIKNIFIINAAAGQEEGFTEINISELGSAFQERSSLIQVDPDVAKQEILVLTLNKLFKNKKIDFLKIDVEGFELEVLQGSTETIDKNRPVVIIEVHGLYFKSPGDHVKRVYDFFQTRDYVSVNILDQNFTDYSDFMKDTLIDGTDPLTGKDLRYLGYGQLAFFPKEQQQLAHQFNQL